MKLLLFLTFQGKALSPTGLVFQKTIDIGSNSLPCIGDDLTDTITKSGSLHVVAKNINYDDDECVVTLESVEDDKHNEYQICEMAKLHGWSKS